MKGILQLIIGSMFCGKTTELIRRADRYRVQKKRVLMVKYLNDTRYSVDCVATHSGITKEAIAITSMQDLFTDHAAEVEAAEVICIDEGQFIKELELCDDLANQGKVVIVAGLDADYQRKPFAEIVKLIPLAESITKLFSVCSICSEDGSFSQRKNCDQTQQELIGSADLYTSLCRRCWCAQSKSE